MIKYRIDGVLQPAMKPIAKEHHSTIISRIKVMAELDIAEKRIPQDGRFRVKIRGRSIDFRVSIMPSVHGEDAVIRILDKESLSKQFASLRLDVLGFDEKELARFRRFIREPYGMVLVTGPTGSGKTTTLYAALSEIQTEEDKIITIEDPVEYQLRGITQIPVNEKKGLTFARGLRSILRHDPDKIMVGEIRDAETADIAIQSALTGHLVFTTVHANNVIDVLGRFLNMKIEPYNFVSALNCVQAQRLVRTICAHCKREVRASPRAAASSPGSTSRPTPTSPFYEGAGCLECGGTGYKGRTAICELLDVTDTIRELILARRSSAEIKRAAREEGMVFLRESAVSKALAGRPPSRRSTRSRSWRSCEARCGGRARGPTGSIDASSSRPRPLAAIEVRARVPGRRSARAPGARPHPRRRRGSVELPEGTLSLSITEPNLVDADAFRQALRSVVERAGILGGGRVALVLPDPVARVALLPAARGPGPGAEAEELIRFRLRKSVPFEIRERAAGVGARPAPGGSPRSSSGRSSRTRPRGVRGGVPGPRPRARPRGARRARAILTRSRSGGVRPTACSSTGTTATSRSSCSRRRAGPDPHADGRGCGEPRQGRCARRRRRSSTTASGSGARALPRPSCASAALPPAEAAPLLEEPSGLGPEILDPWGACTRGDPAVAQALAGAAAARSGTAA